MKQADIVPFYAALRQQMPQPRSELVFDSHFQLLAAVLLSAQATDASVNKATKSLFAVAPTPDRMLALGLDRLIDHIRSIGLYKTKAANLLATCQRLIDEHDGQVPSSRDALERLPGVGRKTANVVLNIAFGEPTIAVDTHVFRVSNRTGLAPGKTPSGVEQALLARTPDQFLHHAHHWLILHGRHVCKARRPLCEMCCVAEWCDTGRAVLDPAAVAAP